MENRYDNNIRAANQMILDLTPGNVVLRLMLAFDLVDKLKGKVDYNVIELGCGEGDLTQHLLRVMPNLELEVLDVSSEMISLAKKKLESHGSRVKYIEGDAYNYLNSAGTEKYDLIVSAWTIHNFPWKDKEKIFGQIFASLKMGGALLMMDKVYVDSEIDAKLSYDAQINRYKKLNHLVREDMLAHEVQDYSPEYKMSETHTKEVLESAGFKNFKIIDRVERDIVFSTEK